MELEDMIRQSTLIEGDSYSNLVLKVKSIQYEYKNYVKSTDESGYYEDESLGSDFTNENWKDDDFLSQYRLDTSTKRIDTSKLDTGDLEDVANAKGNFLITYEVTDNGITPFNDLNILISPITMEYSRVCDISYNNAPQIYVRNQITYTDMDELFDLDTILENQLVLDAEDCINNPPWWYSADRSTVNRPGIDTDTIMDKLRGNNATYSMLQSSLKEVRVWGITISSYLQREVDTDDFSIQENVNEWVNAEYRHLSDLKYIKEHPDEYFNGTTVKNSDLFDGILSYNVELDAEDQWGKTASGNVDTDRLPPGIPVDPPNPDDPEDPPGIPKIGDPDDEDPDDGDPDNPDDPDKPKKPRYQTIYERSVTVYIINLDRNPDMIQANIDEEVRFINQTYLDSTLGLNDYWGEEEYGKPILRSILEAKDAAASKTPEVSTGSFEGKNGDTVQITVNDYSD
jgi:hypothetical protein